MTLGLRSEEKDSTTRVRRGRSGGNPGRGTKSVRTGKEKDVAERNYLDPSVVRVEAALLWESNSRGWRVGKMISQVGRSSAAVTRPWSKQRQLQKNETPQNRLKSNQGEKWDEREG